MDHWEFLVGIGIQTLLLLGGGYGMVLRNNWSTKALEKQMTGMSKELQKLAEVVTMQAVQTTRIDNLTDLVTMLQRNVEDLRRGNGFVRGRRSGIEGEYDG